MTILCLPRPRDVRFEIFENVRGGAAEFQRGFRRDGFDVRRAANAVGSEDFFRFAHGVLFLTGGVITLTLGGSTLTSVTLGGVEISTFRRNSFPVGQVNGRADLVRLQSGHRVGRAADGHGNRGGHDAEIMHVRRLGNDQHRQVAVGVLTRAAQVAAPGSS